jgi:hypothetical protein
MVISHFCLVQATPVQIHTLQQYAQFLLQCVSQIDEVSTDIHVKKNIPDPWWPTDIILSARHVDCSAPNFHL